MNKEDKEIIEVEKNCDNCRYQVKNHGFECSDCEDYVLSEWRESELSKCQRHKDELTQTVLDLELKLELEKEYSTLLVDKVEKMRGCDRKLEIATRALKLLFNTRGDKYPHVLAKSTLKKMEEV